MYTQYTNYLLLISHFDIAIIVVTVIMVIQALNLCAIVWTISRTVGANGRCTRDTTVLCWKIHAPKMM